MRKKVPRSCGTRYNNAPFIPLYDCIHVMQEFWNLVVTTDEHEESAFNSASAPVLSMSSVRRDFLGKENEHQAEPTEGNKQFKKQNVHRRLKSSVLSPGSASSVCQSPRLKV
ncbi:hypothetical protein glysoja_006844 [Glycine soja]|nr:hypothetical protein glysoja_006844 [Glycine soja]